MTRRPTGVREAVKAARTFGLDEARLVALLRRPAGLLGATRLLDLLFEGRSAEGNTVIGHLRKPRGAAGPVPLVVLWGGIDSFKEDRPTEQYLNVGLATLAIDMPGVGDAPVAGSEDAERMFDAR